MTFLNLQRTDWQKREDVMGIKRLSYALLPLLFGIVFTAETVAQQQVRERAPTKIQIPVNQQARATALGLCSDAQAYVKFLASQPAASSPNKPPTPSATARQAAPSGTAGLRELTTLQQLATTCTKPPPTKQYQCTFKDGSVSGTCDEPGSSICGQLETLCNAGGGTFSIL